MKEWQKPGWPGGDLEGGPRMQTQALHPSQLIWPRDQGIVVTGRKPGLRGRPSVWTWVAQGQGSCFFLSGPVFVKLLTFLKRVTVVLHCDQCNDKIT